MIVGMSEGDRLKFEVVLMSDGFIVRARFIESGEVIGTRDRMFRTAPAAFAYAELAAMEDAEETSVTAVERLEAKLKSDRAARVFDEIRARLADSGVSAAQMAAWSRQNADHRAPKLN